MKLTQSTSQEKHPHRGRIFPEHTSTQEQKAERINRRQELGERCRPIFEQIRPQLIANHYNWFIAIDPETGNYLLHPSFTGLMEQININYPPDGKVKLAAFRLNENGACGLI